jgi:hypothetical protein
VTDKITQANYVAARDALIPDAERAANREYRRDKDAHGWTRSFFKHMDRLCREHGVVK